MEHYLEQFSGEDDTADTSNAWADHLLYKALPNKIEVYDAFVSVQVALGVLIRDCEARTGETDAVRYARRAFAINL